MINETFYKIFSVEEINDYEKNEGNNLKQKIGHKVDNKFDNNFGHRFGHKFGHRFGHKFGHRFRRSKVVYNFIDYVVKNVNLINCSSDEFKSE